MKTPASAVEAPLDIWLYRLGALKLAKRVDCHYRRIHVLDTEDGEAVVW